MVRPQAQKGNHGCLLTQRVASAVHGCVSQRDVSHRCGSPLRTLEWSDAGRAPRQGNGARAPPTTGACLARLNEQLTRLAPCRCRTSALLSDPSHIAGGLPGNAFARRTRHARSAPLAAASTTSSCLLAHPVLRATPGATHACYAHIACRSLLFCPAPAPCLRVAFTCCTPARAPSDCCLTHAVQGQHG
jgi:hypothetical protein